MLFILVRSFVTCNRSSRKRSPCLTTCCVLTWLRSNKVGFTLDKRLLLNMNLTFEALNQFDALKPYFIISQIDI